MTPTTAHTGSCISLFYIEKLTKKTSKWKNRNSPLFDLVHCPHPHMSRIDCHMFLNLPSLLWTEKIRRDKVIRIMLTSNIRCLLRNFIVRFYCLYWHKANFIGRKKSCSWRWNFNIEAKIPFFTFLTNSSLAILLPFILKRQTKNGEWQAKNVLTTLVI